jgi:low temperature requirement protein LtrA
MINPGAGLLRTRRGDTHSRVTFVELFFDLVFVFAVTQLSHALLEHLTLGGLVETTLLLMAVWWVWVYTSWVTNWLDPDRTPVRLLLFTLMLAGLAERDLWKICGVAGSIRFDARELHHLGPLLGFG